MAQTVFQTPNVYIDKETGKRYDVTKYREEIKEANRKKSLSVNQDVFQKGKIEKITLSKSKKHG